jgi:phosphatidylinositol glycan class V
MLFSASPILYWFVSYCTTDETMIKVPIKNEYDVVKLPADISKVETEENLRHSVKNIVTAEILDLRKQTIITKSILVYFLIYFIVGTFMFCNFFPWT